MQKLAFPFALAAICFDISLEAASELKPVGILRTANETVALFDEYLSPPQRFHRTLHLKTGEVSGVSAGDQRLSVQSIDPRAGLIEANRGDSNQIFKFKTQLPADGPGIILEDASASQILAVYSNLSKRNILPHPKLPKKLFTLKSDFANDPAGAEILRKKLKENEVTLIPLSNTFEIAAPSNLADQKFDVSKFLKPKNPPAPMEAGTLELFGAPTFQLLQICAELLERDSSVAPGAGADPDPSQYEIRLVTSANIEEVTDALQLFFEWRRLRLVKTPEGAFSISRVP